MVRSRRRWFGALVFGALLLAWLGRSSLYWTAASVQAGTEDGPAGVPSKTGAVMVHGGGGLSPALRSHFIKLAGGPGKARMVVIPTASEYADRPDWSDFFVRPWREAGVASVELLHTRDRARADQPDFVKPLKEATGVWIAGGKQARLAEAYVGTEVEYALRSVLQRGGAVGGTSAGAAILSGLAIMEATREDRNQVVTAQGFDLVPGTVVDQHFLRRNRVGRLTNLLAKHPDRIGLGVDENTSVVVTGTHMAVVGDSYVVCFVPANMGRNACTIVLKPGDATDMESLRSADPAVTSSEDLELLIGN